jgi:hypothetical protein
MGFDDEPEVDIDVYVNAIISAVNLFSETWKAAADRDPSIKTKLPLDSWDAAFYSFVEKAAEDFDDEADEDEDDKDE